MRLLLFPLLLLSWPVWGETGSVPLTAEQARSALQAARWPDREPGCWQAVTVRTTKKEEVTETRTELREAGQPALRRTEIVRRSLTQPERPPTASVRLRNAEGTWELVGDAAIRWPELLNAEDRAGLKAAARAKVTAQAKQLEAEGRQNDPAARAALIAKYVTHSGVREATESGARLRVRLEFGPEAQKLMREMADEAWKREKKQMSVGLRLIASPLYALKRDDFLPVAQETVIEEASGLIVSRQNFAKGGKPIAERRSPLVWKPVAPVTPEFFAVPAGLKRIEAKSLSELEELKKKHRGATPSAADETPETDDTPDAAAPAAP